MELLWSHEDELGRNLKVWRRHDGILLPRSVQQVHLGVTSHVNLAAAELLRLAKDLEMPTTLKVELETLAVIEGMLGTTMATLGMEREP